MTKRKAESQTGSLTPDHQKSGIDPTSRRAGEVRHAIGKLLMRATSCFKPHPNRRFEQRIMTPQSGESPNWDSFGTPPWESRDKKPFGCRCRRKMQRILYGGRWWLPLSSGRGESCESRVVRGLS
jgi:hypothetical protein